MKSGGDMKRNNVFGLEVVGLVGPFRGLLGTAGLVEHCSGPLATAGVQVENLA
jgi:hypothetical protein